MKILAEICKWGIRLRRDESYIGSLHLPISSIQAWGQEWRIQMIAGGLAHSIFVDLIQKGD